MTKEEKLEKQNHNWIDLWGLSDILKDIHLQYNPLICCQSTLFTQSVAESQICDKTWPQYIYTHIYIHTYDIWITVVAKVEMQSMETHGELNQNVSNSEM